jgi:gamma-glutamylputrescine oxidase
MHSKPIQSKVSFDRNVSVWTKNQPPVNAPLKDNQEVDVAVIGGGNTGLSAAYHIKKLFPERSVIILEAKGVGHGASGRNGGMLLPQPAIEHQTIENADTHKLTYDATVETMKEIMGLMDTHGLASGYKFDGSLKTIQK